MNESINNGAVCKTVPATLGLLKNAALILVFSKTGLPPPPGFLELFGHFSVGSFFLELLGHFLCHKGNKVLLSLAQTQF